MSSDMAVGPDGPGPSGKGRSPKRRTFVLACVILLAFIGALAYLLGNVFGPVNVTPHSPAGTGTGSVHTGSGSVDDGISATTGAETSFAIAVSPTAGDPLLPGGPVQTIAFTVANLTPAAQTLNEVSVRIADENSEWTPGGCSAADYIVSVPAIRYGEIAPTALIAGTVTVAMKNTVFDQDACKNLTVPLRFTAH